ncbi:MAG TPA: hypothetical protein VJ044_05080 [Candidatus Hodarchaeales archaeon]|nr:hypothetical protein [Candidatus Hodarchaeales archaeon]
MKTSKRPLEISIERHRCRGARMPLGAFLAWGILGLVLGVTALPRPILAQESDGSDLPCSDLRSDSESQNQESELIEWNGIAGMFFPMATARLILCEVRELRLRQRSENLDQQLIESWRLQVEFTERQLELAIQARDQFESIVEVSERRAQEAEDRLGAWYRSPWFLISIGAILTIGLYFAASYGIRSITLD